MNEKEKMLKGLPYDSSDKQLKKMRNITHSRLRKFNKCNHRRKKSKKLLNTLLGKDYPSISIYPPFYCEYGTHIELGNNVFFNTGCSILDAAKVTIGNNVMLGPNVSFYTSTHPLESEKRQQGIDIAYPIRIKDNVWIGGGCIINPGVCIGDNTVIGSGSVVTKDLPANVMAAGNPCKVIKLLNDEE